MNKIPDPIFLEILDYLPLRDLLMLRQTNSGLNRMLKAAGGPVVVWRGHPFPSTEVGFKGKKYTIERKDIGNVLTWWEKNNRNPILRVGPGDLRRWRIYLLTNKNETITQGNTLVRLANLKENSDLRMWQGFPFY